MSYLYLFDKETFEYRGAIIKQKDVEASLAEHRTVYFKVPYSTDIKPPTTIIPNKVLVFDPNAGAWDYIDDFRHTRVINVETKEVVEYGKLGPIEYPFSSNIPNRSHLQYIAYSEENGWQVSDRESLLSDIWKMRKTIRDWQCDQDIEYNGHLIHVDKRSYNDLLLAAQEILLTGDRSISKTWITADVESITLTGEDFINILHSYGMRRQRLVYESNEAWKRDETMSNDVLLDVCDELSAELMSLE